MARRSKTGLLLLGAAGVGAVVLWPTIQQALGGVTHTTGGGTPGGGAGGGCNTAFIPGKQYVSKEADGLFHVIVNGRDIYSSADQGTAERYYNSAVCP